MREEKDSRSDEEDDGKFHHFLGNPCRCGWCYTELSESIKECSRCGSRKEKTSDGFWITTNALKVK